MLDHSTGRARSGKVTQENAFLDCKIVNVDFREDDGVRGS